MISAPVPTSWPSGRTYIVAAVSRLAAVEVVRETSARPAATPAGRSVLQLASGSAVFAGWYAALVSHIFLPMKVLGAAGPAAYDFIRQSTWKPAAAQGAVWLEPQ